MDSLYSTISALVKNDPSLGYVLITIMIVGFIIKKFYHYLNFHESYVTRRFYKRISSIDAEGCNELTKKYLVHVKEQEIYTLLSGIKTAPQNAKMLMDLYLTGVISNQRIKGIYGFLKPYNGKVSININLFDKSIFIYSLLMMVCLISYGFYLFLSILFNNPSVIQLIIGFVFFIGYFLLAITIGSDYFKYHYLTQLRESLLGLNKLANPEDNISLFSFSKKSNKISNLDQTAN
ncbi:hypothetical protein C9J20_20505 [Photobacterium phosphoreum]|uniref:hypothetical protein n=1 Tax=Photobacterium phosphoreum TaxID=659 RepID=UPI000D16BFC0|nr:hypothetical protein [Photobacterium phosphoreum]PSU62383.1 hypothetical protein CTM79_21205 [Photobacterium phosphoreum]PSW06466.1 hypothetical protein C9J20_20505 [Photobacterium phosphoreum]